MPNVSVESDLLVRAQEVATEQQLSVEEILNDALRQYLWERDRRKIAEEGMAYIERHAALKAQYLGQYIAMQNGGVIDHDIDLQVLKQRVRAKFGRAPILLTRVEENVEPLFIRRGFHYEVLPK